MTHFDRFFACAVVALSPLLEACTSLASRSTSAPRTEEELFEHWPVVHRDQDATVRQDPSPSAPAGPSAQAGAQGSPTGASGADEEIAQEGKDWYIEVLPYLWLPAMHGQVGARGTTAPVGVNTSEAIDAMKDDLEGAFVAHSELGWNRFRFLADFSYVNLGSSTSTALGNVKSDIKQIIAELGMAYELVNEEIDSGYRLRVEPLLGARLNYMDVDVRPPGTGNNASGDEAWVDAFGGMRFRIGADEGPGVFGRFDAGAGGSDATWNALVGLDWRIGGWLAFTGGYRWLSIDYSSGSGNDRVVYDILALGPFLGISFRF